MKNNVKLKLNNINKPAKKEPSSKALELGSFLASLFVFVFFCGLFFASANVAKADYYQEGVLLSTDLLSGVTDEAWITGFSATSSVPASTTVGFLFSVDNENWYNHKGEKGIWDTMASGTTFFNLSNLNWATSSLATSSLQFFYKARFTSNIATITPIVYAVSLEYSNSYGYTSPDYGYYDEGIYVSNILSTERAKDIEYFGYNLSSLPASTTAQIMFSNDGVNYYSATGTAFYWSDLSSGDHLASSSGFDLTSFSWKRDLYYKIKLTSNTGTTTPVISEVKAYFTERDPVKFTSIIDPDNADGTDYTSLSAWESAVQSDLTSTSTLVFSYTTNTASGVFPDGSTIIGETSKATGTLIHLTGTSSIASKQLLVSVASGKFQKGEKVYLDGASSNYVYLSTSGDIAIAVAKCRSTGGTADTNAVTIDGWTTSADNYIKIWTDPDDVYGRHQGVWSDSKYRLEVAPAGNSAIIGIKEFVKIDGIQIKSNNSNYNGNAIYANSITTDIEIFNCIIKGNVTGISYGIRTYNLTGTEKVYNNIIYNFDSTGSVGISISATSPYIYNNTVFGNTTGIVYASGGNPIAKNNISYNNITTDYSGTFDSSSSNNISSDGSAPGTNSKSSTIVKFLDAQNNDFHLDPTDTVARNAGKELSSKALELSSLAYDIDGTARGSSWDIGADEVPVEYISTICENTSAGGDCTNLDYQTLSQWEDAVEVDLTASTTRVFSGAITGSLSENNTVNLCSSTTDLNIDGLVVATTSDQILIDGITGTSSPLTVASGTSWSIEVCSSSANYWTITGANDELGASPIAIAKIDGAWAGADTNTVNITGWDSDNDNYIKVYTTSLARHDGKWSDTAYRFVDTAVSDYQSRFKIYGVDFVRIDGLQFQMINTGGYTNPHSLDISSSGYNVDSSCVVSNNIFENKNFSTSAAMTFGYSSVVNATVYNNIIYGYGGDYVFDGTNDEDDKIYAYNNTFYNCKLGFRGTSDNIIAKNNIIASTTDPFNGTFHASSTNNATDGTDTPTGASGITITNATINFVSTASGTEDFHLTENNPDIIDKGANLSNDEWIPASAGMTRDIDGSIRHASSAQELAGWDIGADEVNERTATSTGRWTATSTWSGGYIPRSWETVTIPAGIDVTYDPGNLFQDDFEENAFSDWTGNSSETGNTKVATSAKSYAGDYSSIFTFDGTTGSNENYYYKTFSADQSIIYYRVNILVESDSLSDTSETNITEFTDSTPSQVGGISIYDNAGTLELKAYYHNGTALTAFSNTKQIATSTWYTVEYYQKADAGNGEAYFWVNGTEIASSTSLSNASTTRRIYAGQLNGANDEAITYYLDDIALDTEHRVGYRPTATSTERATAIDYKICTTTIADTASLITGAVIDTDYSYRYPLWIYGDISVDGTLDQNGKSEIKIKNDSSVEHGIIVSATGKLDIDGTSKAEQDAVISSVIQDSNHNGYIYCQEYSECYIKSADISYLGANETHKTGIYIASIHNETSGEGTWIIGNKIHDNHKWIEIYGSRQIIDNNIFYSNSDIGIEFHGSQSVISNNKIYTSAYRGIRMTDYQDAYNIIKNNIIINTGNCGGGVDNSQQRYNSVLNNIIIGMNNSYTSGIMVQQPHNIDKNNIIAYNGIGIYVATDSAKIGFASDYNIIYGNDTAIGYWGSDGNISNLQTWQASTTQDTNSISTDPLFYNFDNTPAGNDTGGSERSVSSATSNTLSASSPSWTTDEWKGYTVWTDDDFSSATGSQFRYILSNTTDTLTIAGTWSTTPDSTYEFKIIDFTVGANSPALGAGATTTPNTDSGQINIGAITDYSYSTTDSKAYNSMQLAHDNDSTGAGDTITTYAMNLLESAIDGSVTSIGNGLYYFNIDADITENDTYNGYYLYITAGADRGKYYLITDTASSTDTLYIFDSDLNADLNDNDEFIVVDRVYTRVNQNNYAFLEANKDGTQENPITWNTSGKVILDGQRKDVYGIYIQNDTDAYVIDGFNIIKTNNHGIHFGYSDYNTIKNNQVSDIVGYGSSGVDLFTVDYSLIENNVIFNIGDEYDQIAIDVHNGSENNVIKNNNIFDNLHNIEISSDNNLAENNVSFDASGSWSPGIYLASNKSVLKNNIVFKNYNGEININGNNNYVANNICFNSYINESGIFINTSGSSSTIRNNIIFNETDGIDDSSGNTSNDYDFNFFYNNTEDIDGGGAIGTSSITGYDPNFKQTDTGTADSGSASTTIIDTSQNWTANEFVGYGLKITIGGTDYWAGITSNTSDHLYLAPDLDATPSVGDSFIITDFSITGTSTATTTPLGNGCRADGSTESGTVNMGAILDFSKNITDDMVFNSMQDAHDDAGLSPGDTVTTYAVNEVENGTTGTSTDLGPMIKVEVNENAITEDNQYEGMYFYIEAGENRGKYYLIVDSDESSTATDTVTLLSDSVSGFNKNDVFVIVDRVYERVGESTHGDVCLNIIKSGTPNAPINWNTSGKVIIDGIKNDLSGAILIDYTRNSYSNVNYNVIDGFVVRDMNNRGIAIYTGGNYNTIKNNEFYHIGSEGYPIAIGLASGDYNVVSNNYIDDAYWDGIGNSIDNGSSYNNLIKGNTVFNASVTGIVLHGNNNIAVQNRLFANPYTQFGLASDASIVAGNFIVAGNGPFRAISLSADNTKILNNVIIHKPTYGNASLEILSSATNNEIYNNLLLYNTTTIALDDNDTTNSNIYDFNFYYGNTTNYTGAQSIGTSSITGYDPNFINLVSSTVDTNSTTTNIIDATQSWTTNQWVGYGFKITISGTDYWAGITSNTSDRLYLAPVLDAVPSAGDAYIITDFSIGSTTATTTPLGQGCSADGTTEPGTVNMGAQLGYTYNANINSGTKYNNIQDAHNDASLASGDNVLVYAVDEVITGTIGTTTDLGPMVQLAVDEASVTSDNDYAGMYLYMLTGANQYEHYLIARTDEASPDNITIVTDTASSTFQSGDTFRIVDRVYNQISNPNTPASPSANLSLTKSGSSLSDRIEFSSNGTVIIDASNSNTNNFQFPISNYDYNIQDTQGIKFIKLNNFQLSNSYTRAVTGNTPFQTTGAGYQTDYCWPTCANQATEFVATVDPGNGAGTDFTSLSTWESSIQADLTAANTMVFSFSTSTGIMPIGTTVIGQTSGARASTTVAATSSSQILLYNITPNNAQTFQSGELVYVEGQATSTANVVLSDNGNMAIAVAKCRTTDGTADTNAVTIDGWTTSADNYIKIWTDPDDVYGRHNGVWSEEKYRLDTDNYPQGAIVIGENYTRIDGLQIKSSVGRAIFVYNISGEGEIYISNNFSHITQSDGYDVYDVFSVGSLDVYFWNNIGINDSSNISAESFSLNDSGVNFYLYSNLAISKGGFAFRGNSASNIYMVNNIGKSLNNSDFQDDGNYFKTFNNNLSYDGTANDFGGTGNKSSTTVKFLDAQNNDFHLDPTDTVARNAGKELSSNALELSSLAYDIDGTARGNAWDIGADEVPVEYISTICENTSAGGDCANLDYQTLSQWEDAVEVDLTASTTRVFSGTITGNLNENNQVWLYDSTLSTTSAYGYVVATTTNQILIDGIIGSSTLPLTTASGTVWRLDASNYWTVTGATTSDDLGASPIAIAKIDGAWSVADTNAVTINGWNTDNDNYIKVYTVDLARHDGKWSNSKYRIDINVGTAGIYNLENYLKIDGLQLTATSSAIRDAGYNGEVEISNNVIKGSSDNYRDAIYLIGTNQVYRVWNNIVYNATGLESAGIHLGSSGKAYVYNNTLFGNAVGIDSYNKLIVAKNNIVASSTSSYNGIFATGTDYNVTDSSDNIGTGSNNKINQTFLFISTTPGSEDFHLLPTDTGAKDLGVDLSGDSYLKVIDDIDSQGRVYSFDIGADETAIPIYRSVGPSNTTALDTGASGSLTINDLTATFAVAVPDNVGVGDVIEYDSSEDGTADALAFIHKRISSTVFKVLTASGTLATEVTADTDWSIFRAYTSLASAEAGTENTGIDASLRDFDTWSGGKDIVASNEQWNIACYADAVDATSTTVDGWTTGEQNFIKIYTPVTSDEVGVSQRHSGKAGTGYVLNVTGNNALTIYDSHLKIYGLEVIVGDTGDDKDGIQLTIWRDVDNCEIAYNLIHDISGDANSHGIYIGAWAADDVDTNIKIYNNIIYNIDGNGIFVDDNAEHSGYIYNNTINNCNLIQNSWRGGIADDSTNFIVKNNISVNNYNVDFYGSFNSASGYNISSDSTAPGSNSKTNVTVKFIDATNDDYHLAPDDTSAIDAGTSTVNSLVTNDIDGKLITTYDIGADDASIEYTATVMETNGDFSTLASWESNVQTDLTATSTRVFSLEASTTGVIQLLGQSFVGQTSNASGTLVHVSTTSNQILLENISGTFVSGEAITDGTFTATTTNAGNMAIAVAKIDGTWSSPDTTIVEIDGWTTDANNYIRIYTTKSARHLGKWSEDRYRLTTGGTSILISEEFIRIRGLQIANNGGTTWGGGIIVSSGELEAINDLRFSYNIIKATGESRWGIYFYDPGAKIWNNLIYDFDDSGYSGIFVHSWDGDDYYIYNNTIINCEIGIEQTSNESIYLKNNIVSNNTTDYSGTFHALSSNNISSDSTAPGSNSKTNTTVNFADAVNYDFHLALGDTVARNAGVDLSGVATSSFFMDIDGTSRGGAWDIGADEAATEFVSTIMETGGDYNSLSTWEADVNTNLIASNTLAYSGAITGSITDGAVLTLYRGGNSQNIFAIAVATTTNQILIANASTTDYNNFTSFIAQSGDEWRVDASNFWTVSGSGDQLGAPVIAVAKIDGAWSSPDTTDVDIDGWSTGPGNYIRIYTTESARHSGVWSDIDYRLENNSTEVVFANYEDYTQIEGIQIYGTGSGRLVQLFGDKNLLYSNIIKGNNTSLGGVVTYNSGTHYIFNNVIYDLSRSDGWGAIDASYSGIKYIYNNTIYNSRYGIWDEGGSTVVAKNNLVASTTDGFYGTFANGSDFNLSDIAGDAPGSNSQNGVTVAFVSTTTANFHLASTDTSARNKGVNLTSDTNIAITTDIDGEERPWPTGGSFDIGADQYHGTNVSIGGVVDSSIDLDNGLVGHWTFNELTGTTVYDKSGNGNDGTWSGSGDYWNNAGRFGSAGEFNGSNDHVGIGNSISEIKTIAFWLKSESLTTQILELSTTANVELVSGEIILNYTSSSTVYVNSIANYNVGLDFYHVVIINNNGIDADNINIGKVGSVYYGGIIDEIRFYNRVLSQREIAELYNNGKSAVEWHFRNNLRDTGTNCELGNCKNLTGSGNIKYTSGYLEESTTALSLGGSSYASLADDDYFDISSSSDFSLLATIKTSDTGSSTIISKRTDSSSGSAGYLFGLDYGRGDGIPYFEVSDGVDEYSVYGNTNIADNKWHTVMAVFDESNASGNKIYIDGVDKTAGRSGTIGVVEDLSNSIAINIGRTADGAGLFTGSIDRIAFFPYALTRNDVLRENANSYSVEIGIQNKDTSSGIAYDPFGGSPPVAHWKLDEMRGSTAKDYASSSLDGIWYGSGSHHKNGKVGMGGNFNGSDDYVDMGDIGQNLNSISFWMKSNNANQSVMDLDGGTHTISISANIMTTNGFVSPSIYINTVQASSTNSSWNFVSINTDTQFNVSNLDLGRIASNYFNGQIDDVKIYNYARTQAQIAWDYNRGKPVAHWKFDEASSGSADASSLIDSSGNGNHGTGSSTGSGLDYVSGKFGNALDFDGVDDFVNVGDLNYNINTISFWVKADSTTEDVIDLDGGTHTITISSGTVNANNFVSASIYIDGKTGSTIDTEWHHILIKTDTQIDVNNLEIGRIAANYYSGLIDDVRIYNYVLPDSMIKEVYNNGRVRFGE